MHYFKQQKLEIKKKKKLFDEMAINLSLPRKFASMKNIRR